jgi:hypothetical protein
VLELTGVHHMLHKVPRKLLPPYKAATAVFNGWRDSWLMLARKRPNWNPKTTPPPGETDILFYDPSSGEESPLSRRPD